MTVTGSGDPVTLPWSCKFGTNVDAPDWCGITQDQTDNEDWAPWSGLTPSANFGPTEETIEEYCKKDTCYLK